MNLPVVLETGEDGWVIAECPTLPGCLSQGKTDEEAMENIKKAIDVWLKAEADKRRNEASGAARVVEIAI